MIHRIEALLGYVGFHLLLLTVSAVLFCWPFASGFRSRAAGFMGPYLFAVWAVVIALLFAVSLSLGRKKPGGGGNV